MSGKIGNSIRIGNTPILSYHTGPTKPDYGTNPVTSGNVFSLEMGLGQSYRDNGNVFTDTSASPLPTGAFAGPPSFVYQNNRALQFSKGDDTNFNLRFGAGSKLSYDETWSFFIYWKPLVSSATYIWDKSFDNIDRNSLVYGYNNQAIRPWNGNYRGMDPISSPTNVVRAITFTKDLNSLSNNYKAYIDGVNTFTTTSSFNVNNGTSGCNFNRQAGDWEIYNFYVYNRALSATEVGDIYNYVTSY